LKVGKKKRTLNVELARNLTEDKTNLLLSPCRGSSFDHMPQRPNVRRPNNFGRQTQWGETSQRGSHFLLDVKWSAVVIQSELLCGLQLEIFECFNYFDDTIRQRFKYVGDTEPKRGQANVAKALLADCNTRTMTNELMREDTRYLVEYECEIRMYDQSELIRPRTSKIY
jgi:hypothetical protein